MLVILGAMQQEVELVASSLNDCEEVSLVGRRFLRGTLFGKEVLVAFSRWGKVAAAATVSAAITRFPVEGVIFTGVAGALDPACKVGDIVVGTTLVQHDLDARPLFARFEVPLTGEQRIKADPVIQARLARAARRFVDKGLGGLESSLGSFGIARPSIHEGLVVSGDRFVADAAVSRELKELLPDALCVEMEGAAVAQVCTESSVPFGVVRTISDSADHGASVDFVKFLDALASPFSVGVIREFLTERPPEVEAAVV